MTAHPQSCPMSPADVVSTYFIEHRAKLIDIAAFLDRLDRATGDAGQEDFRIAALKAGLALVNDGQPERVKRLMELFSDPTTEPRASAAGMKGAAGAWPGFKAKEGGE